MNRKLIILIVFYALSVVVMADESNDELFSYATRKLNTWKSDQCDKPILNYPNWQGFPVVRCPYTDIKTTVKSYMLNADKDRIAKWVVTACREVNAENLRNCICHLSKLINDESSGGIFPIDGFIPEPLHGGRCFLFHDGVTVFTKLYPESQKPVANKCDDTKAIITNYSDIKSVGQFARIISTTRSEYKNYPGTYPVNKNQWVIAVREEYKKAWTSDKNVLISAKAKEKVKKGELASACQ